MAHSSRIPADYVEGSSSESGSESDGSDGSEQGGGAGRVDGWTTSHQVHAPAPLVVRYPTPSCCAGLGEQQVRSCGDAPPWRVRPGRRAVGRNSRSPQVGPGTPC